ncbi:threonylcarbamoyl-AMP synthase, partial [Candidatus Micrarchaeota archaeon CG11_big_fil_rev_8_21_14_0_20_47_5]
LRSDFEDAFLSAKKALKAGKLIIYPTDTVYGIGCDATNNEAVGKVYEAKGRGEDSPLSVVMADLKMIGEYCEVRQVDEVYMHEHLPGPYTFILKCKEGKELPVSRNGKIGVRVPDHFFCITLSRQLKVPIVSTSANLSGKPPPTCVEEIDKKIADAVSLILDGGKCKHSKPSTVVDLVESKILRAGAEGGRNPF